MNLGIVSPENILNAHMEGEENKKIQELRIILKDMIKDIKLNYYEIKTNSTCSTIKIIAQQFFVGANL
jgi:hypothetical protein